MFSSFDRQKYYKMYSDLFHTITDGSNADIPNNIKKAFKMVNGKTYYSKAESDNYIKFDGIVDESYTVGGSIMLSYLEGDSRRLAEDLTMAYFRTTEGADVRCNLYQFMDWVRGKDNE